MDGFSGGASDDLLVEWRVTVGDRGVDFDDRIAAVMRVDGAASLSGAAEIKGLPVRRCPPPFAEPGR
jgi:hypothetical protein